MIQMRSYERLPGAGAMLGGFSTSALKHVLVAALLTHAAGGTPAYGAQATPGAGLPKWAAPADIDQAVPRVLMELSCPLPELLGRVTERVQELVANLHQFSARERIEHVEIGRKGNPLRARKTNFNYVAQINQAASGSPSVEEYRTGATPTDYPEVGMVDTGTAAFALIFHRFYIEDFVMSCEGLADVKFRPAWQLHFAPRTRNLFHVYRFGNDYYPVKLKGRAWIAADNYEVLRLETDLLEPVGQIRLQREHSNIEYGPVEFRNQNVRLWLPQVAELYMDYRGHRYREFRPRCEWWRFCHPRISAGSLV